MAETRVSYINELNRQAMMRGITQPDYRQRGGGEASKSAANLVPCEVCGAFVCEGEPCGHGCETPPTVTRKLQKSTSRIS